MGFTDKSLERSLKIHQNMLVPVVACHPTESHSHALELAHIYTQRWCTDTAEVAFEQPFCFCIAGNVSNLFDGIWNVYVFWFVSNAS